MRRSVVDCGDVTYTIREIPAALLRKHTDIATQDAQIDMLGMCVLDADGNPLLDRVDDEVPMRHLESLINGIAELSGFAEGSVGNADAPGIAIVS